MTFYLYHWLITFMCLKSTGLLEYGSSNYLRIDDYGRYISSRGGMDIFWAVFISRHVVFFVLCHLFAFDFSPLLSPLFVPGIFRTFRLPFRYNNILPFEFHSQGQYVSINFHQPVPVREYQLECKRHTIQYHSAFRLSWKWQNILIVGDGEHNFAFLWHMAK